MGKTSFLRAGLLPATPEGWGTLICQPGEAPFAALARALAPEFEGDAEAISRLVDISDQTKAVAVMSRWREHYEQVVLVVDQFEELFTLNPPEVQARFATLIGLMARDVDIHVVLSMRDDFLYRCHEHEALTPVFSGLIPVKVPGHHDQRRALVDPAAHFGYAFEDEGLVDEMLDAVAGERGALPLLAFAVERLWVHRDHERKLLTRRAYSGIGGVAGALAHHAETTLEGIGSARLPVVRELFRNLVTAEGTRAVREWGELLSIFSESQRESSDEVLRALIDARLLTSYEIHDEDEEPTRRVEIIHESLLANWPRLVRWQTQNADAAQLRDQLRQAARTWNERDRADDFLWTGKAYREFSLWREDYPGGLTAVEEDFARAMTTHARRIKRRRRVAVSALFVILLAVLAVVGVSRQQAVSEINRAEASKLVALGRMVLDTDRTEAIAYATASLERSDTPEARRLALRALWAGAPTTVLPGGDPPFEIAFSPDGHRLAVGYRGGVVRVFRRDGGAPVTFQAFEEAHGIVFDLSFSPDGRLLVGGAQFADGEVRVWETEGWQLVRVLQSPEPPETLRDNNRLTKAFGLFEPGLSTLLTVTFRHQDHPRAFDQGYWVLRRWPIDGGPPEFVGEVAGTLSPFPSVDLSRGLLAVGTVDNLHLHHLDVLGRKPPRVIGRFSGGLVFGTELALDPTGELLAACDVDEVMRLWRVDGDGRLPEREFAAAGWPTGTAFSPDGSRLAMTSSVADGRLWDLWGPAFADPLRFGVETGLGSVAFTPDGRWLAVGSYVQRQKQLAMCPLSDRFSWVLRHPAGTFRQIAEFHRDESRIFLVVAEKDGFESLLSWPLTAATGREPTVVFRDLEIEFSSIAVDPRGRFLVVGSYSGVHKIPLDGAAPTVLEGVDRSARLVLDPTGRYLAGAAEPVAVIDLETGERLAPEVPGDGRVTNYAFDPAGRLVVTRGGVVSRWDPETRTSEVLLSERVDFAEPLADGRSLFVIWEGAEETYAVLNLEDGSRTELPRAHQAPAYLDFYVTGSIVASGHPDGEVHVGSIFDEEAHLLLGHEPGWTDVWVSPKGKWVLSIGSDGSARLWPTPDLTKQPFHTLPHNEFVAKLKVLTNLRAVPSDEAHTGYTIEPDFTAYRGWEAVPEW